MASKITGQGPPRPMVNEHGVRSWTAPRKDHPPLRQQDGGRIEVRANDLKDAASLEQIRGHFQHFVRLFAEGNFNAPMLVHTARTSPAPQHRVTRALQSDLHWELQEIPARRPHHHHRRQTRKRWTPSTTFSASRSPTTKPATAPPFAKARHSAGSKDHRHPLAGHHREVHREIGLR